MLIRMAGWVALVVVLVLVAGSPGASAGGPVACNTPILKGAERSAWGTNALSAALSEGRLKAGPAGPLRDGAFDSYGVPRIIHFAYDNPDTEGCTDSDNERSFPTNTPTPGFRLQPKVFVSKDHSFARLIAVIRNTTGSPVDTTFTWTGKTHDFANVAKTSSGDRAMDTDDRWATTCSDEPNDGCGAVTGDADREPEIAINWQGSGQRAESADAVLDLEQQMGSSFFEFQNVTLPPGEPIVFMQVVSMARTVTAANKSAQAIDRNPSRYGVFQNMSNAEIEGLQNWNPQQAEQP